MKINSPEHTNSEKIRTNNIEKPSTPYGKLVTITARNAKEINAELEKTHGLSGLIDDSLHINPSGFSTERGGIYEDEDIHNDVATVHALDRLNSAADIPSTQEYYKKEHKIETPEGIVEKYLENKEKSKSNQAEMAITALMHKILKERFLVVRTSMFDDYKNGIDNLILDKETGAIICAFDEVLENEGDKERGPSKKIEKIKKSAVLGGTRAKYGISLSNKKVVRAASRNIPVFYLSIEYKELIKLTDDLSYNQNSVPTDIENKLFKHLVTSISEQKKMLESLTLPPVMRKKLEEFQNSLDVLESFVSK